jgi:hypothetical protein
MSFYTSQHGLPCAARFLQVCFIPPSFSSSIARNTLSLTTRHIANPQNVFDESSFFRFLFLLGSSAFFLIDYFDIKIKLGLRHSFPQKDRYPPDPHYS